MGCKLKETELTVGFVVALYSIAVLVLLVASCTPLMADSLHAGGWSVHPFSPGKYTNSHDLVAYEHEIRGSPLLKGKSLLFARFRNSYGRESYGIGIGKHYRKGYHDFSAFVGAVRGYTVCFGNDDTNSNTCPMVTGMYHYTKPYLKPGVIWLGEAFAFEVRVDF